MIVEQNQEKKVRENDGEIQVRNKSQIVNDLFLLTIGTRFLGPFKQ